MALPTLSEAKNNLLEIHHTNSEAIAAPLLVQLKKDGHVIWLIGTRHTKDADDPQVAEIEKVAGRWLKETGGGTVCLEGRLPPVTKDMTRSGAVADFGEGAVLAAFGLHEDIVVTSIEPTFTEVTAWALELMPDPAAFASWALLNMLSNFLTADGGVQDIAVSTLTAALPKIGAQYGITGDASGVYASIASHINSSGIATLPLSLEKIVSATLNPSAVNQAQKAADGPHVTNRAAVAMNLARDFGLLCNTLKAAESTESVIVWTGLNHLISQLPAFESVGFKKSSPA